MAEAEMSRLAKRRMLVAQQLCDLRQQLSGEEGFGRKATPDSSPSSDSAV